MHRSVRAAPSSSASIVTSPAKFEAHPANLYLTLSPRHIEMGHAVQDGSSVQFLSVEPDTMSPLSTASSSVVRLNHCGRVEANMTYDRLHDCSFVLAGSVEVLKLYDKQDLSQQSG